MELPIVRATMTWRIQEFDIFLDRSQFVRNISLEMKILSNLPCLLALGFNRFLPPLSLSLRERGEREWEKYEVFIKFVLPIRPHGWFFTRVPVISSEKTFFQKKFQKVFFWQQVVFQSNKLVILSPPRLNIKMKFSMKDWEETWTVHRSALSAIESTIIRLFKTCCRCHETNSKLPL